MALILALPAVALSEDEVELILEPEQEIAAGEPEGLELEVDTADDLDLALELPGDASLEIPGDLLELAAPGEAEDEAGEASPETEMLADNAGEP